MDTALTPAETITPDVPFTHRPKKILIAFPDEFLKKIDWLALVEHRSRSDLVREACRRYLNSAAAFFAKHYGKDNGNEQ